MSHNSIECKSIAWFKNNFSPNRHFPAISPLFAHSLNLHHLSPTSRQTKLLLTANIGDCLSINIWFFSFLLAAASSFLLSCLCIAFIVMQSTMICCLARLWWVMYNKQKLQLSVMDVSRKDEKMIEIDVRRRGESRSSSCATLSHMDRRMEFYIFTVLI